MSDTKIIHLRSDTVTKPTRAMLNAMMSAKVGDDVFGEDPTVRLLEEKLADMAGMESAVFAPSGTQSNLMGMLAHCRRGDEYIVGQTAHTYLNEGGGAAVFGSIQPQPIDFNSDGTLDLEKVASVIKPIDDHYARSKLLCLENTTMGKVLPLDYLQKIPEFCSIHNLSSHLDGARVFNAAVKLNVPLKTISQNFDSISICFSKGLGTLIKEARHWRKMLGGGMRQIGIMAAACLYALEHNVARLSEDHDNATILAHELSQLDEIKLVGVNTNIMLLRMDTLYVELRDYLVGKGIIFPYALNKQNMFRLVTHLDITRSDVSVVVQEVKNFFTLHG